MTFETFRRSFYYGDHADVRFKFLASMRNDTAADAVAEVLHRLGEAFDTGDIAPCARRCTPRRSTPTRVTRRRR